MRTLYSINEVTIVPAPVSSIRHRSECDPFYEHKKLPLFSAPMSCVINEDNYKEFEKVGINTILPRNISLDTRYKKCINTFCAFGLEEAKSVFLNMKKEEFEKAKKENKTFYVCIDIANGHMEALLVLCKKLKCKFGHNIKIMTGNIARPCTYMEYAKVGIDYVRVGIGSGNACFPAGTKITMADGSCKSIEAIVPNDFVKTKNGDFRVVATHQKQSDRLLRINNSVSCTPDHKFYVVDKDKAQFVTEETLNEYGYWVKASELSSQKHLLVKCFT